jgi:hypothetical protein
VEDSSLGQCSGMTPEVRIAARPKTGEALAVERKWSSHNGRMSRRFIGGLRILPRGVEKPSVWLGRGLNASWPLAELLLDDEQRSVLLRVRWALLRGFVRADPLVSGIAPTWEAPLPSVTAEEFGRSWIAGGVLLRAPERPLAIFWCVRRRDLQDVLDALPRHDRAP